MELVLQELNIFNLMIIGIVKGHKRNTDNDRILDINFNDITNRCKLNQNSIKKNDLCLK